MKRVDVTWEILGFLSVWGVSMCAVGCADGVAVASDRGPGTQQGTEGAQGRDEGAAPLAPDDEATDAADADADDDDDDVTAAPTGSASPGDEAPEDAEDAGILRPTPAEDDAGVAKGPGRRPAGNQGTGFYVSGNEIYDANDHPFLIRGINNNHWWGAEADDTWWTGDNTPSISHLARTGANSARVVFGPFNGADTPAERRAVVEAYIDHGVVPIVEDHRATGGRSAEELLAVVDVWLDPENLAWLKEHERYLILNIANEWGPAGASDADLRLWRDTYVEAIRRLRQADVRALLMVDGHQYGQRIEAIVQYGAELLSEDPEHNIVFSQHLYGYWGDPGLPTANAWGDGAPYDMEQAFTQLEQTRLPIVIGEFAWEATDEVPYTTRTALAQFQRRGFGWLAWAFNLTAGNVYDIVKGYEYNSDQDLTDYGRLIVTDPELGLVATSKPASIFE